MVELKEKANNYAEENVISVLKEAFAKVYADGYRNGYKDCQEEIPVDLRNNQTEFVDLGLPSGTLWSTDYERQGNDLKFLPYGKAELLNIPTRNQWEELANPDICRWEYDISGSFNYAYCIGPNGTILKFSLTGLMHTSKVVEEEKAFFWILEEKDGNEKSALCIYNIYDNYCRHSISTKGVKDLFSGYKLPVRLVKAKHK